MFQQLIKYVLKDISARTFKSPNNIRDQFRDTQHRTLYPLMLSGASEI